MPTAAPATIRVAGGPLSGLQVPVRHEPVTMGTAQGCTPVLPPADGQVEGQHARIWHRDGRYMIHRLARTGAVIVDGQPVQWAVLESDDRFRIGPHEFQFQVNGAV